MIDAILGSGLATPPTPEERAQLKRIIRLRMWLWCVAGLWLTVSLSSLAFGFDSAVVGGGLVVAWFILGVRLGLFTPCPRSGRPPLDRRVMDELRGLVQHHRLFELADEYGPRGVDSSACVLRLKLGGRAKTIAVSYPREDELGPGEREEIMRFLRVWDRVKQIGRFTDLDDACHIADR